MSEATTDQETGPTTERKPIGGDEADFEAVLIDGILGFSLSIGNAILLLVGAGSRACWLLLRRSPHARRIGIRYRSILQGRAAQDGYHFCASAPCGIRVPPRALLPHVRCRDVSGASIRCCGCCRTWPGRHSYSLRPLSWRRLPRQGAHARCRYGVSVSGHPDDDYRQRARSLRCRYFGRPWCSSP